MKRRGATHIGIDFDNTIVSYDRSFHRHALKEGLISKEVPAAKNAIRAAIRALPDGNRQWTRLQGEVYGTFMDEAELPDGLSRFVKRCREKSIPLVVVSHKTEYPAIGGRVNLRHAALRWMEKNRFFESDGLAFSRSDIIFEPTFPEKLSRIADRHCTHFIDDLEEVFNDPAFPEETVKILYAPVNPPPVSKDIHIVRAWDEVYDYFFE